MASLLDITWDSYENLVIRDVHTKWHQRIIDLFMEHKFKNHNLFSLIQLQSDDNEVECYKSYLKHLLNHECSVAVVNDKDEIVSVALVGCMTREMQSWQVMAAVFGNTKIAELIKMRVKLYTQYAQAHPELPFDSLHIFEYYIPEGLKIDNEFMHKFFNAICETGRHMLLPRVTFSAMTLEEQDHARRVNFHELAVILYALYRDKYDRRPFAAFRNIDEMYVGLFEKTLVPILPYYEMPVRDAIHLHEILETKTTTKTATQTTQH